MTQDGHGGAATGLAGTVGPAALSLTGAAVVAPAERISATLDSLAEALLGPTVTRQSPEALFTGPRAADPEQPPRPALFDTWLTQSGHGRLARPGHGTLVSCAAPPPTGSAAGTIERLLTRYGREPVRGVSDTTPTAFQLPVSAEPSAARLRPAFAAPLAELAAGRQTLVPAELPTGSGVEVRLSVPPAFHALTARGGDQATAEQLGEVAEELFAADGPSARRDWAVLNAALLDESAAADVRFSAVAAVQLDGRPSNASLVVALHRDRTPIAELAAELATSRPQAEVWTVILPSGPAVVLVQGRTGAIPAALAADGARRWVVSSVVQAFLPLPDGVSLLTVQLGTAHGEDWELYATVFAQLLRSVEFGWDGVDGRLDPAAGTVPLPPVTVTPVPVTPVAQPAPPVPTQPVPAAPVPQAAPTLPQPAPPAPAPAVPAPPVPAAPAPTPPPVVAPPPPPMPPTAPPAQPAAPTTPAPAKGTPVNVPPPDFDPFAPPTEPAPSTEPTAAPVTAPAASAAPEPQSEPAPAPLDPFGTVMANQPLDPFGTVTRNTAGTPAKPTAAPTAAPATPPPGKGTRVNVPPPDFDPFAPQTEPEAAATTAEEAADPAPTKGTRVNVPPPDFDPFAPENSAPPATTTSSASEPSAPSRPDPFA